MIGVHIPMLVAIFEYGILLAMKKFSKKKTASPEQREINQSSSKVAFRELVAAERKGLDMDDKPCLDHLNCRAG